MFLLFQISETTSQEETRRDIVPGPLGLADGSVGNNQITASSYIGSYGGDTPRPPEDGRLNGNNYWAYSGSSIQVNHWFQVDFLMGKVITGIQTQARPQGGQWITELKIKYGQDTAQLTPIQESGRDKVYTISEVFEQIWL